MQRLEQLLAERRPGGLQPTVTPWPVPVEAEAGFGEPVAGVADVDAIRRELAQGRKIQAIKLYRDQTGAGLKEAKDAVEAMERLA